MFFLAKETTARGQRALIGFAAGVMTAASIWSLLLPAIEQSAPLPGWLPASVGLLVGTVFLGALDALLPRLRRGAACLRGRIPKTCGTVPGPDCTGTDRRGAAPGPGETLTDGGNFGTGPCATHSNPCNRAEEAPIQPATNPGTPTQQADPLAARRRDALLMTAITLHNIPEGMAVGLAFALAAAGGEGFLAAAALALGIGIQNFPEGAAVALPLHQAGRGRGRAFVGGMLSGAVEPVIGILTALCAAGVRALMPWLLSFAAGAMLYVVVEEMVPQAHSRAGTVGFVSGFLVMMVLDVALG
ncbi:MAG: ZIP family metal transporter [Oscillospiraceae bacterium]|nr:ZIP family metal transporter [Oscillospiraceae bacterium]